ncbi:MAG: CoA transferase, partial [Gammaproteobacteria bacterium]|nr:CoA transferase [Gammaproteobacteria bacterium]
MSLRHFKSPITELTPTAYAGMLCDDLDVGADGLCDDQRNASDLWADSGAMALTGYADGPALGCPAPLAACAQGAWQILCQLSGDVLDPEFPAYRMFGERAALFGHQRQGATSPGGSCRLLECVDGWLAVNLPREHDWQSLPALLQEDVSTWEELAAKLAKLPNQAMLDRARLLGLAVARDEACANESWCRQMAGSPAASPAGRSPLVVDLSSLWAGPLCADLLAQCGARVIKLECQTRPDGARHGHARFFDLLNARKQSVALDFDSSSGRRCLQELLKRADIV